MGYFALCNRVVVLEQNDLFCCHEVMSVSFWCGNLSCLVYVWNTGKQVFWLYLGHVRFPNRYFPVGFVLIFLTGK